MPIEQSLYYNKFKFLKNNTIIITTASYNQNVQYKQKLQNTLKFKTTYLASYIMNIT